MQMKKKLVIILAVITVLLIGGTAGATMAYLNGSDKALNELQVGSIDVVIRENGKDDGTGFKPPSDSSTTAPKKVEIVNPAPGVLTPGSTIPIYVRVAVVPTFRGGTGPDYTTAYCGDTTFPKAGEREILISFRDGKSVFKAVLAADWESHWLLIDDVFYYASPLEPGNATSPLLETVERVTGDDGWECLEIDVFTEALNANTSNTGDPVSSWPVKVGSGGKLAAN